MLQLSATAAHHGHQVFLVVCSAHIYTPSSFVYVPPSVLGPCLGIGFARTSACILRTTGECSLNVAAFGPQVVDESVHRGIHTHHMHTCMHAHMAVPSRFFCANVAAAKWVQCGIAWDCRCAECFFTTGMRPILPMVKSTAAHQQLPNVHPNLSRLQPARPSLLLMGSCAAAQGYVRWYEEALQCPCSASGAGR